MDVDSLPLGVDFVDHLERVLTEIDVSLVLIGPNWLDTRDEAGRRRLDDPEDFVRLEVAAALRSSLRVVPVLVDGAQLPRSELLPEPLRPLTRRQALIFHRHGGAAIRDLITAIEQVTRGPEPQPGEHRVVATEPPPVQVDDRSPGVDPPFATRPDDPTPVAESEVQPAVAPGFDTVAAHIDWRESDSPLRLVVELRHSGRRLARNSSEIICVAFGGEGRLGTCGSEGAVRIWAAKGWTELTRLTHERASTNSVAVAGYSATPRVDSSIVGIAFSPDGELIATGSRDCSARVWDPTSGRQLVRMEHRDPVVAVAFLHGGARLLTANGQYAAMWEIDTGRCVRQLEYSNPVAALSGHPDGKRIAIASGTDVEVWEIEPLRRVLCLEHPDPVPAVAFSPDGSCLAVASGRQARLWSSDDGRQLGQLTHAERVTAVAFHSGGQHLATAGGRHAGVWNLDAASERGYVNRADPITGVAFSHDGNWLATCGGKTVSVWTQASREP